MKEFIRMTPNEQTAYMEKIDKFAEETLPRLITKTEAWLEQDLKEYYAGVELLNAWRKYTTKVQQLRSWNPRTYITTLQRYIEQVRQSSELGKLRTISANDTRKFYANVPHEQGPDQYGISGSYTPSGNVEQTWHTVDGRLPKDLSAYKHLLSPRTRQETEKFRDLYSKLTFNSEMAKTLAQKEAPKNEIAPYAQRAVEAENAIADIWEKVDIERAEIEKKLNIDKDSDTPETSQGTDPIIVPGKPKGSYTKDEIERMTDKVFATECRIARVDANQKYISRTDTKNTAKNIRQKKLRIQELEDWGIEVDEKYKEGLD